MVLHLRNTKTGRGAVELVVVVDDVDLVGLIQNFLARVTDSQQQFVPGSLARFRSLWNKGIQALALEVHGFKPHSIRRGGAVNLFQHVQIYGYNN